MSIKRNYNLKKTLFRKGISLITIFTLCTSINSTIVLANTNIDTLKTSNIKNKKCEFSDLNKLSYEELIKLIKDIKYSDVPGLFEFSKDSYEFFKDKHRIEAIIKALEESGQSFTVNDDKGIPTLIEFLRAGFYLGFYNKELSYLKDINFKNKCLPAIKYIENNPNFALGTNVQDNIVKYIGKFAGNTSLDNESINNLTKILIQFNTNKDSYIKEYEKKNSLYEVLKNTELFLASELRRSNFDVKKVDAYGNIDIFLNELDKLTEESIDIDENNEWLTNNLIYFIGRFSKFRENKDITKKIITNCSKKSKYLSSIYLECISALKLNFDSKFSDGTLIDYNEKLNEAKNKYLPKTYKFDNNKIIIKTGDKVSEEKVKRLYWAANEVKAQFFRLIGNDKPLEEGHADDILNIVIYNSPEEYKLNKKLYGYSTENGGIYIENIGTFFTYERTEEESIYTLEELFRHEFTHYLQGRYLVQGIWGQSDFYKNNSNKLTWYDEGTAEFFAGSTREDGIKPRKSIVRNLSEDKNERQSVKEILHAKYGSWEFYNYGFAFANYMYEHNIEQFQKINNFIKNNDVDGYTKYIEFLTGDLKTNEDYEKNMEELVNNSNKLTVPLVSDEYIRYHSSKDEKEISKDILDVIKIKNTKFIKEESDFFETFNFKGTYENKSNEKIADLIEINNTLNNALKKLDENSWSGYKTVTAYFTNYKVDNNGNYSVDVKFHGILKNKEFIKTKNNEDEKENNLTKINNPYKKIKEKEALKNNKKIKGFLNEENPCYTYSFEVEKEGEVNIDFEKLDNLNLTWHIKRENEYVAWGNNSLKNKFNGTEGKYLLTVYDYTSKEAKGEFEVSIKGFLKEEIKKDKVIEKVEDNNAFAHAISIENNVNLEDNLDDENNVDFFKFNIKNPTKINISIDTLGEEGIAWVLYDSNNCNEYILSGIEKNNMLENTAILSSGEYYLSVYKYNKDKKKKYKLKINTK